jgi:hypothetical protein
MRSECLQTQTLRCCLAMLLSVRGSQPGSGDTLYRVSSFAGTITRCPRTNGVYERCKLHIIAKVSGMEWMQLRKSFQQYSFWRRTSGTQHIRSICASSMQSSGSQDRRFSARSRSRDLATWTHESCKARTMSIYTNLAACHSVRNVRHASAEGQGFGAAPSKSSL